MPNMNPEAFVALVTLGGIVGGFAGTVLLQLLRRAPTNGHTIETLARMIADLTERVSVAEARLAECEARYNLSRVLRPSSPTVV